MAAPSLRNLSPASFSSSIGWDDADAWRIPSIDLRKGEPAALDAAISVLVHPKLERKDSWDLNAPPLLASKDVGWTRSSASSCCQARMPIIMPDSRNLAAWTLLGLVCAFCEVFTAPVYLAFDLEPRGIFYGLTSMANSYFLVDIVIGFCIAFKTKDGVLITDRRMIARRYIQTTFVFDFLAGIPWEWISLDFLAGPLRVAKIKILRFVRVARLMRVIRLTQYSSVGHRTEVMMDIAPYLSRYRSIVRLCVAVLVLIHWMTCIWYFVGTGADGWVTVYLDQPYKNRAYSTAYERYSASLYFVMTTMTTVGYGDFSPQTLLEMQVAIMLFAFTCMVFGWLTGSIMEVACTLQEHEKEVLNTKLMINRYMMWRSVPFTLRMRIQQHMMFLWETTQGQDAAEREIKEQLPPGLREDLSYHVHGAILESAPFLKWMTGFQKSIKHLANQVETIFFAPEDYLFTVGSPHVQIFMIVQGRVRLSRNDMLLEAQPWTMSAEVKPRRREPRTLDRLLGMVAAWFGGANRSQPSESQAVRSGFSASPESSQPSKDTPSAVHEAERALWRRDMRRHCAARLIQRKWRDCRRANRLRRGRSMVSLGSERKRRPAPTTHHMLSTEVAAPAYLGESCLWQPLHEWDQSDQVYMYNATCKSRVEVLYISRDAIRSTIKFYSPWLAERFEFFRLRVAREMEKEREQEHGVVNTDSVLATEVRVEGVPVTPPSSLFSSRGGSTTSTPMSELHEASGATPGPAFPPDIASPGG